MTTRTLHLPYAARDLPDPVRTRFTEQRGVFSRREILDAGVSPAQVRWRTGTMWASPLPGVILIGDDDLDDRQRQLAALAYAGSRAVLSGPTAARLYGVAVPDDGAVHVLVPRDCAARRTRWVHVHRSSIADPHARTIQGVRASSAPRSIVDAARLAREDRVADALVIEACQRHLTTPEALARELARHGHAPGTGRARRALELAEAGAWSVAEADLFRLVRRSAVLPPPLLNPALRASTGRPLTTPDFWWDDVALAVMVHSKAHHVMGDDWDATVRGDGDLSTEGAVVIGVTPVEVRRNPAGALLRIEDAYTRALHRPRTPDIECTPRYPHP